MSTDYEKQQVQEILDLIDEYNSGDREIPNKKLNEMTHRLYYEEQEKLSQPMIDAVLAINSFTEAAAAGGRFQELSEFVPDLKNIVNA